MKLIKNLKMWWAGHKYGFWWVHCNGESSKTSAMLACYHHPQSITWRWALYWQLPKKKDEKIMSKSQLPIPWIHRTKGGYGSVGTGIFPFLGGLNLSWQQHMFVKK